MRYLVSGLEMRQLDLQAIQEIGVAARVLMEVAGRGVASEAATMLRPQSHVTVACGLGNNGGDGFVAARALAAMGHATRVFVLGSISKLHGDAKAAFSALKNAAEVPIVSFDDARGLFDFAAAVRQSDLVIDALLGTGLHSDVRGIMAQAIDVLNEATAPVLSVDIPSGVSADTGQILGQAVEAECTVTFGFAKRGHYVHPGAGRRGRLCVVDIGIPKRLAAELGVVGRLLLPEDGPSLLPARATASHKGQFGHVVLAAGSAQSPGAAVLALMGALRAGAGLVSWAAADATVKRAPHWPCEAMLRLTDGLVGADWAARVLDGATAVVVGPGWGQSAEQRDNLMALLAQATVPVCLDADALNILSGVNDWWHACQAPVVLTPHPKEMARLTHSSVQDVQRDRLATALEFAVAKGCLTVLKGAGTVIADPDGTATVIGAGSPALATGGTGDVLAGLIGGLLAQGIDPSMATGAAALLHAVAGERAAERHGVAGTMASDVIAAVGEVWTSWQR